MPCQIQAPGPFEGKNGKDLKQMMLERRNTKPNGPIWPDSAQCICQEAIGLPHLYNPNITALTRELGRKKRGLLRYSGMSSSQLSIIKTRLTYNLMLFFFFLFSKRSNGARRGMKRRARNSNCPSTEKCCRGLGRLNKMVSKWRTSP